MSDLTMAEMEEDVDSDGEVDGVSGGISTRYCRVEGLAITRVRDTGFLIIDGDNGGENVQIRVPFHVLEDNGFTVPTKEELESKGIVRVPEADTTQPS